MRANSRNILPEGASRGLTLKILQELRCRGVYQAIAMYIAGAWITIEVSEVVIATLCIPGTALRYLFVGAALIFPLVVVFAWIFDITSGGMVRTPAPDQDESADRSLLSTDYWKLALLAILALAIIGRRYYLGLRLDF